MAILVPGRMLASRGGMIPHRLHGQPQVGRLRQRGQRVRVSLPPHSPGQEPPAEELAAGHGQPVQAAAGADHGHHAGPLRAHLGDRQPVPQAPDEGQPEPVAEHQARGRRPGHRPDDLGQRVAHERRAEHDDVSERDSQGQVHPEVDQPPGLPAQPAPHGAHRDDADQAHQAEADGRGEHVRVPGQQDARLVPRPGPGGLGVAQGEEQGVRGEQADRPRGDRAVQPEQAVLARHPLHERDAADQQDHDQGQVRADHAGEAARVGEQPAAGGQLAGGLAGHGDGQGGAQPGPGGQQRETRERGVRPGCGGAAEGLSLAVSWRLRRAEGHRRGTHGRQPGSESYPWCR